MKKSYCGYKNENVQQYSSLEKRNNGKTKKRGKTKKERRIQQQSKERREDSPTNTFLVGNYGLKRAETGGYADHVLRSLRYLRKYVHTQYRSCDYRVNFCYCLGCVYLAR